MKKIDMIGSVVLILLITVISVFAMTHNPGPIEIAKLTGEKQLAMAKKARTTGILCGYGNIEECEKMIERAEKNPRLKAVFLKAKVADVDIYLGTFNPFTVGELDRDKIAINPWFSDEKIIAYLEGE